MVPASALGGLHIPQECSFRSVIRLSTTLGSRVSSDGVMVSTSS